MTTLIDSQPDGILRGQTTLFYFGVKPLELGKIPVGSEFTCVYAPEGNRGWLCIRFMVLERDNHLKTGGRFFQVKAERTLEPHEIQHFERLLGSVGEER